MIGAKVETLAPYAVASIASALLAVLMFSLKIGTPPEGVSFATLTFGVIASGFAATQRNMILGMNESAVLKYAVREGFHEDIVRYLMDSVYAGIWLSGFSVVGILVNDCSILWKIWIVMAGFFVVLILSFMTRNEMMMSRILKRFLDEQMIDKS